MEIILTCLIYKIIFKILKGILPDFYQLLPDISRICKVCRFGTTRASHAYIQLIYILHLKLSGLEFHLLLSTCAKLAYPLLR